MPGSLNPSDGTRWNLFFIPVFKLKVVSQISPLSAVGRGYSPYFNNITFFVSVNTVPDWPVDSSRTTYIPAGKPVALKVIVWAPDERVPSASVRTCWPNTLNTEIVMFPASGSVYWIWVDGLKGLG